MKATVLAASSKTLPEIMDANDLALVRKGCGSCFPEGKYLVFIRNVGANDVYLTLYKASSSTEGVKIAALTGELSLSVTGLEKINLIANAANNEVRYIITT